LTPAYQDFMNARKAFKVLNSERLFVNKYKILGGILISLSLFIIILSFFIIFLDLQINIGQFNISPYLIKVINFLIILGVFSFIAYVGYIMIRES